MSKLSEANLPGQKGTTAMFRPLRRSGRTLPLYGLIRTILCLCHVLLSPGRGRRFSRGRPKPPSNCSCLGICSSGAGSAGRRATFALSRCWRSCDFPLPRPWRTWVFVAVAYGEGEPETYVLPLTMAVGPRAAEVQQQSPQAVLARVQRPDAEGLLCEAWWEPPLWEAVLAAIADSARFQGTAGALCALPTQAFAAPPGPGRCSLVPTPLAAEQSNTSVVYGDRLILKLFRRVADGVNPDLELGRFLTERTSFPHIAPVAGALEYHSDTGEPTTVGILHGFVPNQGDAWGYTLEALDRYFAAVRAQQSGEHAAVPPSPCSPWRRETSRRWPAS